MIYYARPCVLDGQERFTRRMSPKDEQLSAHVFLDPLADRDLVTVWCLWGTKLVSIEWHVVKATPALQSWDTYSRCVRHLSDVESEVLTPVFFDELEQDVQFEKGAIFP